MMAGVDMSDAFLVRYHNTRKRLKKYSYLLYKKKKKKKQVANLQGWMPSGSPSKTAPPTNMTAPHYTCYITATASKQNPCQWCVVCYKMNQHRERYSCEKFSIALCTVSCFKILPHSGRIPNGRGVRLDKLVILTKPVSK
jgi:hypothetical protein